VLGSPRRQLGCRPLPLSGGMPALERAGRTPRGARFPPREDGLLAVTVSVEHALAHVVSGPGTEADGGLPRAGRSRCSPCNCAGWLPKARRRSWNKRPGFQDVFPVPYQIVDHSQEPEQPR
jgi:hypothetical protein